MTPAEKRKATWAAKPIPHGTPAGWHRHRRAGTLGSATECGCRAAQQKYQREYRAANGVAQKYGPSRERQPFTREEIAQRRAARNKTSTEILTEGHWETIKGIKQWVR